MILLDTHVLIWLNEGSEKLGTAARRRIVNSPDSGILVSAITFWEIALLVEKQRLVFDRALEVWFETAMQLTVAKAAPIDMEIAVESVKLPGPFHADPADRFIVATSRLWKCPLMTADQAILTYGRHGHVDAIDASL